MEAGGPQNCNFSADRGCCTYGMLVTAANFLMLESLRASDLRPDGIVERDHRFHLWTKTFSSMLVVTVSSTPEIENRVLSLDIEPDTLLIQRKIILACPIRQS